MFDISFSEILVIAVVAVIVIGPERLPKTVRTLGHLFGRAQRYVNEVKTDIQREMELDELRKVQKSVQDVSQDIERSVQSTLNATHKTAQAAQESLTGMESEIRETVTADPGKADAPTATVEGEGAVTVPAELLETMPSTAEEAAATTTPSAAPAEATPPVDEPPYAVPEFLKGEVELSIPDTVPAAEAAAKPDPQHSSGGRS